MTDILFNRFRNRFPPLNGYEKITIYGAYERIYLDLIGREFMSAPFINPEDEIKTLASKVFDVNFEWGYSYYDAKTKNPEIIFNPAGLSKDKGGTEELMRYQDNYSGHTIEIKLPARNPEITISTGNRGKTLLLDEQRDKYFEFVEEIYKIFLESSRK